MCKFNNALIFINQLKFKKMFKLKSKLIIAVIIMFGFTAFLSCENDENHYDVATENNQSPLSVEEMAEFGIASIEQGDFSDVIIDNSLLKSSINFKDDNVYMLRYVNTDKKSIIKILPNNELEIYFLDNKNQFVNFATIIPNNINESGYVDDFIIDSEVQLRIIGDKYVVTDSDNLKGYADWADCVGDAVTACYTEDLGCAALFTVTFPFAMSAVMIACI